MNDDAVRGVLDNIEDLLPPHATEYRSGTLAGSAGPANHDEPATEPIRLPSSSTRIP
ncbi:hypothetical protein [Candidatus Protofrankia californiensis]|uniref:hypothetical protein n=1 Tax=Candidatus Protofrankia californiensis TaxID=1839754 RepID=UPI0013EB2B84|nr:hypothetical protein [Candidatus Protofrankia californiensis]